MVIREYMRKKIRECHTQICIKSKSRYWKMAIVNEVEAILDFISKLQFMYIVGCILHQRFLNAGFHLWNFAYLFKKKTKSFVFVFHPSFFVFVVDAWLLYTYTYNIYAHTHTWSLSKTTSHSLRLLNI